MCLMLCYDANYFPNNSATIALQHHTCGMCKIVWTLNSAKLKFLIFVLLWMLRRDGTVAVVINKFSWKLAFTASLVFTTVDDKLTSYYYKSEITYQFKIILFLHLKQSIVGSSLI